MRKIIFVYIFIIILILAAGFFINNYFPNEKANAQTGAIENLDEMIYRKTNRFSQIGTTYTPFTVETSPNYEWQPETLEYQDTVLGTEVWKLIMWPGKQDLISKEIDTNAWSFDGAKFGFFVSNVASTRRPASNNPALTGSNQWRWVVNTDGTKMRAVDGYGRSNWDIQYQWLRTEPGYITFGGGSGDGNADTLYKCLPDSNNHFTCTTLLDTNYGGHWYAGWDGISNVDSHVYLIGGATTQTCLGINYAPTAVDVVMMLKLNGDPVISASSLGTRCIAGQRTVAGVTDDPYHDSSVWDQVSISRANPAAMTVTRNQYAPDYFAVAGDAGGCSDPNYNGKLIRISGGTYPNYTIQMFNGSAWVNWDTTGYGSTCTNGFFTGNETHWHASALMANDGSKISGGSGGTSWTLKWNGSASDGGWKMEGWNPTTQTWGVNEEVMMLTDNINMNCSGAYRPANCPVNPYGNIYMGHPSQDRWKRYSIFASSADAGTPGCTVGYQCRPGTLLLDALTRRQSNTYVANYNSYYGSHHSWNGWTDWPIAESSGFTYLKTNYYLNDDRLGGNQAARNVVQEHYEGGGGISYNAFPRPNQSPDGTKVAYHQTILNNSISTPYINYAVVYYPYPPEIYNVTANGGTVTVRADWGTNSGNWRGYTKRKWPDETTGTYLPPREISNWRLWRSADGVSWIPVTTVAASAWSRYNFKTGLWTGNTYWDITDAPGNGTFYYGLTSIETSGLESHKLSNVYRVTLSGGSGSGSQTASYPADPGGKTSFSATTPTSPPSLTKTHQKAPATAAGQYTLSWTEPSSNSTVRYYNVYALDGVAPTATQQRRIASLSRNICSGGSCSWVDWLGATNGTTRYGITAVDVLGRESSITVDGALSDTTPPSAPTGLAVI